MEQIAKKDKLQKSEIFNVAFYYNLGEIFSYSLIKQGNINSNYIISTSKGKYILRVYKFKTTKEINSELWFLNFLFKKGFPCPVPIGNIYKSKNKNICCFKYIEGHKLKNVNTEKLRNISKLLAELHILTKNLGMKYSREGEGLSVIKRYLKDKKNDILKSEFKDKEKFINYLELEIKKITLKNNLPKGVVHVDVKPENIIIGNKGQLNIIDFDNFYFDSFIIDIGSTLMWLCTDSKKEKIDNKKAKVFLDEYDSRRKLTEKERKYIISAIKFNCLKQAFKYAYICLPRLRFAERHAYYFIRLYKNISKGDII